MTTTPWVRRNKALSAALLSAALVLTGCGSDDKDTGSTAAPAATTRTITAGNGTVTIPADPQRVVALGNTSQPFIDIGGKPIGVTELSASELDPFPRTRRPRTKRPPDSVPTPPRSTWRNSRA